MKSVLKWAWIPANIVGMAAYLWLASALWVQPDTEGQPGGPGDAFYWFLVLIPIVGFFAVLDLVVLAIAAWKLRKTQRIVLLSLSLIFMAGWLLVLQYDHMRAFRYIDEEYSR